MSVAHAPRQNHLLAALPATDFERVQSRLKLVQLHSNAPAPCSRCYYDLRRPC